MQNKKSKRGMTQRLTTVSGFLVALLVLLGPAGLGYAAGVYPGQGRGNEQGNHGRHEDGQGKDNGQGSHRRGHEDEGIHGKHRRNSPYFRSGEIETIRRYYNGRRAGLPPGLAKRGGNLPPGLEKHLERDGTLPPGLQKRLAPLPYALERQLPRLPTSCGCRRGVLGPDVLIMNSRTGRILDIARDVLRR